MEATEKGLFAGLKDVFNFEKKFFSGASHTEGNLHLLEDPAFLKVALDASHQTLKSRPFQTRGIRNSKLPPQMFAREIPEESAENDEEKKTVRYALSEPFHH
eukprot:652901-Prorocentrum_minimum.AAC.3